VQVGAKAALFAGAVLLLGAGVFVRWIARDVVDAGSWRRIRAGVWAGAVLLVGGSALDVIDTLSRAVGSFDPSLVLSYLSETRHGNAFLVRVALVAFLLWLGMRRPRPAGVDRAVFATMGLALLVTFSLVSHAGAQPGVLPVSADLVHLTGVVGWAGALVYGAWLLPWRASGAADPAVEHAVGQLSAVGFWSMMLIAATGVYASLDHLWGPGALTGTPYGRVLLIKLAVVSIVAAVAAVNRWVLIPSLTRGATAERLGGLVKIESLLLLVVLGVTALLVSQSPPGPPPTLSRPLTFRETVGPWIVHGTLERRDPGRFAVELRVQDPTSAPAPTWVAVDLTLTILEHEMAPVRTALTAIRPGTYQGTFFLPMTGRWQMAIRAGGSTARFPIQTEDTVFIQRMSPWSVVLPGAAVVLVGLGFVGAGLRRMGAGVRGSWPAVGAGTALVFLGMVVAIRAVS